MNRLTSIKSLAVAAMVLGAFGAASAAHARSDVFFTVGVQAPGVYAQPAPVYAQHAPVYVQPRPVYVEPQYGYGNGYNNGYGYSNGWERRGAWGDRDGDGIANVYDRDSHRHQHRRHVGLYGPYGDYDRDGVPNRFDRFPADPYRR
ncbi:MAG: PXPV repeat protein [Ramlibacter sp.]